MTSPSSDQAVIADADASPITFARIAAFPPPGWQVPRQVKISPDGRRVTYLQAEDGGEEMALWAFDVEKGSHEVLVRASDVTATDRPMSREEELRRERQRKRITGVTSYAWADDVPVMLLPLGGDIWLRGEDGSFTQLTDSEEPEIDPHVSADGTQVAFSRGRELVVLDVKTKRERPLTKNAPEGVTRGQSDFNGQEEFGEASGFWWSPTGSHIAYLEVDESKVDRVPVMGYRGGADLQRLAYPRAGTTNPRVRLGVVDVAGGRTRWVDWPQAEGFDPADQYLGRVRFADDGKTLYVQRLSRDQRHLALVAVDVASMDTKTLVEDEDTTWLDFASYRVDGDALLWAGPREDGHRRLELRDTTTGALKRVLAEGAWDVFDIVGLDASRVLFIANRDAVLDRQLYAVPRGGGEMTRLSKEPGVHVPFAGKIEHGWVDLHSAMDRPPQAVIVGPDGSPRGTIDVPKDDDFEALKLRTPERVELKADDGTPLFGALLPPRDIQPGKKHPAIVMVYGGPGVQTLRNEFKPRLIWQHLADRGFAVFQLDNRGSTGRGHAFEAPIHHRMGEVELADQKVGARYLAELPYVAADRVGIYGHSYGGYMSALAILDAPDVFQVAVSGSPVTDWRYYDTGYTERYMGTPQSNEAGYDASSLLPRVDKLARPLLIIHALMDENVHFEHTASFIDALVAADKDFDLLVFPGERHGYRSPQARRYAYRRVVDYFASHL